MSVVAMKRTTIEDRAELNVSGVRDVAMDMASNNLKVNIQPFELRDSPLNREGEGLKNNDVWIDIRDLILLPSGTGGHEGDRYYTPGGLIEVDVPNVASFRNRSRLLRGRNITYDYAEHYLHAQPVIHRGLSFYPLRHNREFARGELQLLLAEAGFRDIDVRFLKSRRWRTGLSRLQSVGTALKDLVPSLRKSLIAWGVK
jgi:hypothetical protein